MAQQFPHGFNWDCADDNCFLNAVNTWAMNHTSLFPGVHDPGILATTQAIEAITGLHDQLLRARGHGGVQQLVDALGGININVHQEVPIGGVGGAITGHIDAGEQHLDGYQTLWYSRSRAWSSDYSRMARQKCVMNAMLHQLSPESVITKFGAIASAGKATLETSIPASEIHTFVDLALKARSLPLTTSLVRASGHRHRQPRLPADPADGQERDREVSGGRQRQQGGKSRHETGHDAATTRTAPCRATRRTTTSDLSASC